MSESDPDKGSLFYPLSFEHPSIFAKEGWHSESLLQKWGD